MRVKLTRFVSAQATLDFPWGIVHRDYMRDGNIWTVVPLNWIFRWARQLWHILRAPKKNNIEEFINSHLARAVKAVDDFEWDEVIGPLDKDEVVIFSITKQAIKNRIQDLKYGGWE